MPTGSRRRRAKLRLWQVWPLWLLFGPLLVLAAGAFISLMRSDRPRPSDTAEVQLASGRDLRVAVQELATGRLRLFSYDDHGRPVRFTVQRTSSDKIETTLMSCQACYQAERPHYTLNNRVICGKCNHAMHYPSERGLTPVQKQCTLIAVPNSVTNGNLVVRAQDVLDRALR